MSDKKLYRLQPVDAVKITSGTHAEVMEFAKKYDLDVKRNADRVVRYKRWTFADYPDEWKEGFWVVAIPYAHDSTDQTAYEIELYEDADFREWFCEVVDDDLCRDLGEIVEHIYRMGEINGHNHAPYGLGESDKDNFVAMLVALLKETGEAP